MSLRIHPFYLFIFICLCIGCDQTTDGENIEKLSDEALLDVVQQSTLTYFTEKAEPNSGMARERYHTGEPSLDADVVTTGGTGFGIMAILSGIERNFISRDEGVRQIEQMVNFLENAPRFRGAWSHWLNGKTGEVIPFSPKDDGGDLVETAFLVQGLLCARQYLMNGSDSEKNLASRIDKMWKEIDWDFYRGAEREHVLFWHWSPNYEWEMNFRIRGYNETLITYILAISSPTHAAPVEVFHAGWAENGKILESDTTAPLPLVHQGNHKKGGPLFWAHYSFLGLNPINLQDHYVHYGQHNKAHSIENYNHCVANPHNYVGYGENCWGLTASYSIDFYAAHSPDHDLGVISPTAALSSFPYTPEQSMNALRYFYEELGNKIWGPLGFYDAFSVHHDWYSKDYLAIDQGPIIVMIENYRSELLWNLFMSCPEIIQGLGKLDMSFQ